MSRPGLKGQSLVESSLILAAFMGLVLGMATVAQMLFVRQTLSARAHDAARWGALNVYDPAPIRNLVLYGTIAPVTGTAPIAGLAPEEVIVGNPGCPGVECRVSVAIPGQGIRSTEPVEYQALPPALDASR